GGRDVGSWGWEEGGPMGLRHRSPAVIAERGAPGGGACRILVADKVAAEGVARLEQAAQVDVATGMSAEQLQEKIPEYDALVVRSETRVTEAIIAAGRRLKVIGRAGVGVDNIDVPA